MSEKSFNQMSDIEPIVLQLVHYIDGLEYDSAFPYMYYRGDKEVVIRKALAKIKEVLES